MSYFVALGQQQGETGIPGTPFYIHVKEETARTC